MDPVVPLTRAQTLEPARASVVIALRHRSAGVNRTCLVPKSFVRDHKTLFRVLASVQNADYRSVKRRERFVLLCHDNGVRRLTFEADMNKKLVRAYPLAPVNSGFGNLAHPARIVLWSGA